MPTSKSAKKRLRQNKVRNLRNRSFKSALKTELKKARGALEGHDASLAEAEVRKAAKLLDRSAVKQLRHPNAVARAKSKLDKSLHAMKAGAEPGGQGEAQPTS